MNTKDKIFIEKAKKKHGDKYDYSKVKYINAKTKVCIICFKHGEFWQTPNSHLTGGGCPLCANKNKGINRKLTTKTFIEKAKKIHGDEYDYSKVEYINSRNKVCITCPEHGDFYILPVYHLGGSICQKCAEKKRHDTRKDSVDAFIKKAKIKHGDKYDYSKVEYINSQTKVCIICPEHGEFWQKPNAHLNGNGCTFCASTFKLTTKIFIEKAKRIHGNKYNYSKVDYINNNTKVCIICPEHGEFWQTPHAHLSGQGCAKCYTSGRNFPYTTEEYVKKVEVIHDNKYDYSKTIYTRANEKICIICPEHGEFWQKAGQHIYGIGCPFCKESHMEKECRNFLKKYKINYKSQYTFEWLKYKSYLYLDFYLPDYNIAIECQGIQHLKPIGFGNKNEKYIEKAFIEVQNRDKMKKKLCEEHNIEIIYINYNDNLNNILKEKLCINQLEIL